jgi:hypothetical protein
LLACKTCGVAVDITMSACPSCGAGVPLARIAALIGIVCRACDAYNDPGAQACMACGEPFGLAPPAADGAGAAAGAQPPPALLGTRPPPTDRQPAPPPADDVPVLRPARKATGATADARLLIERGDAPTGTAFRLEGEAIPAGRAQGPIHFPRDASLEAHHATFLLRDGAVVIRDEQAPGGVYIRLRGTAAVLRPGSQFAVGDRLLRFAGPLSPPLPPPADGTRLLGAPRPEGPAVLVEECLEGGAVGRVYLRVGPSITIGRAGCSITLGDDPYLSQAHAEILVEADGSAKLHDLGSSNGTFIRLQPASDRELRDGDGIRLGRQVLRVEVAGP